MVFGLRRDLWQVGDGEDLGGLVRVGDGAHGGAHERRHFAADARVNFIEHHHGGGLDLGQHRFQRQGKPCALPPLATLVKGSRGEPGLDENQ